MTEISDRIRALCRPLPDLMAKTTGLYERPVTTFVAKHCVSKSLIGVEIGVDRGDHAMVIMNTLPMKHLYLVDPYQEYEDFKENVGWGSKTQHDFDYFYEKARRRLSVYEFNGLLTFIRHKSCVAVTKIPDELDFVYIDGNHNYSYVKRDLELYYPKLKTGGVLGGDNFESIFPGVAKAVIEFAEIHKLHIQGARSDRSYEWWVVK